VGGNAADLDLDPQHADATEQDVEVGRLEHDDCVSDHTVLARGEGAVARAFLLDDRQEAEFAGERVRHRLPQSLDGQQPEGEAALHVACSAARQPAVGPDGQERVGRPQCPLGRHDVDVAVKEQGGGAALIEPSQDVGAIGVRTLSDPGWRLVSDVVRDRELGDRETQSRQLGGDHVLGTAFGPDGARLGDEALQESER
jgi:hypothetical protein